MIDPAELAAQIADPVGPGAAAVAHRLASGLALPSGARMRLGVVTASNDDGTVLLTLGGDDLAVRARRLDSYLPRVDDTVSVLAGGGGDLVVLGRVANERPTPFNRSALDTTARTATNTGYAELPLAVTATARTGRGGGLLIGHACTLENSTTAVSYQSFAVERTADGVVALGGSDARAVAVRGTNLMAASYTFPASLDPGVEYLVRLVHRVTAGTGAWQHRQVWALPT